MSPPTQRYQNGGGVWTGDSCDAVNSDNSGYLAAILLILVAMGHLIEDFRSSRVDKYAGSPLPLSLLNHFRRWDSLNFWWQVLLQV
jgi:hypothetical protein